MPVMHVGSGIIPLILRQLIRAPIGTLLLFGDIDAEQFLANILIAVLIGIGANKARGGARAIDRRSAHAQIMPHDRQIEPGEMKDFYPRRISQQFYQVWRIIRTGCELHEMRVAIAIGQLHQAEAVALIIEAHRLGIDGNIAVQHQIRGQIALM